MSEKRKRDNEAPKPDYRPGNKKLKLQRKQQRRKGFQVGPANLPDGTYKRKTQKIKDSLIQRAKIKKDYEKVKKRGGVPDKPESIPQPASLQIEESAPVEKEAEPVPEPEEPVSNEPHPARQIQIDQEAVAPTPAPAQNNSDALHAPCERNPRERKPRPQPFKREHDAAQRQKAEADARRQARAEAERQRAEKIEERERFRRAMAKARSGGVNGQRKLGRESKVLLERVKKMTGGG